MTVMLGPDIEHAVLYMEAAPPAYTPGVRGRKGFIFSPEGLGELDFGITGILPNPEHPLCVTPEGVGILDDYAGYLLAPIRQELPVEYIRQGQSVSENLELLTGIDPLRTLMISDGFGADIPGGMTIYGVDINITTSEIVYIGIASKINPKEDFIFRGWTRVTYPALLARPIVSGREFKILVYTKGAGEFMIKSITVWAKLTDRRGFNTSPRSLGGSEEQSDS